MISSLKQKLGFWPKDLIRAWKEKKDWIWIHAVSVGEIKAVWPLLLELKKNKQNYPIMFSCTTRAGFSLLTNLKKETDILIFYFPFDLPFILKSLLSLAKVKLLIIVETEIWPFTLRECRKRSIPVILVNARLSEKSFRNYYFFKYYFKNIINNFTLVLSQSESDSEKFKKLGIDPSKVQTLGNIKFASSGDFNEIERNHKNGVNSFKLITIIFASTHNGEEEIGISVYKNLLKDFNNLRLIIAPRHIERTPKIVNIVKKYDFIPILKTQDIKINSNKEIFILNTIGELQNYLKRCDITVLGGTFTKIGGHNIIEPIRAKSYTIIGPYDFKISEISNLFLSANALIKVKNKYELEDKLKEAILNKEIREIVVTQGLKIIQENAKVLEHTTQTILTYL